MLTIFLINTLLLVFALALVGLVLWLAYAIASMMPMLQGPVFVPSADDKLQTMFELAGIKPGARVVDLGAGDGRLVVAAAQAGAEAVGLEINPFLVLRARVKLKRAGVYGKASIEWRNFWKVDLGRYDVVFIYGTTYIMKKLEQKLRHELKPGARVVSNYFTFPNWQLRKQKNEVRLYQV